jgi:hypothetical protein
LASLGVADCLRKREQVHSAGGWHKEDAIVIAQDQVLPTHRPISDRDRLQRIVGAGIEALRAGWDCSQAEDRQPDRPEVGGVAMQAPDHESFQPSSLGLEGHEIADAGFVESSAVVDPNTSPGAAPWSASRKRSTLPTCWAGATRPARRLPGITVLSAAGAQRTGT